MQRVHYEMIYLAACGVNEIQPDGKCLEGLDMEMLFEISSSHQLDALIGMTLVKSGGILPDKWMERVYKAVRRNILFDSEREKILSFFEESGIWYLPLKGIILKDYYPETGMRQMSDNDILFDPNFSNNVRNYMEAQGYQSVYIDRGNHDVYRKDPIFNFELHRTLYEGPHWDTWKEYYKDIKERLVLNDGSFYGYHFSDEDFYVYMVSHMYKHYSMSGTGVRSLLDLYVYLRAKETEMDFIYIHKECETLGIAGFEVKNRELCRKVFSPQYCGGMKILEQWLTCEEKEILESYLASGVYGSLERLLENNVYRFQDKSGSKSKFRYFLYRVFPDVEGYRYYSFFYEHKWLLPLGWLYRFWGAMLNKKRRKIIIKEIMTVIKM